MDLNERLAARRKELAEQEEALRLVALQQRRAEHEAALQAAQTKLDAIPKLPDPMTLRTPAIKEVDLDLGVEIFKEAVERTTKKQLAIFCVLVALAVIGLFKEPLMAVFWAVCAFGYIAVTISTHAQGINARAKQNCDPQDSTVDQP